MRTRILSTSFFFVATSIATSAQHPALGTISGKVKDVVGAYIGGASVFVHSRSSSPDEMKLETHTDRFGEFHLTLPAGAYDILVVSTGFRAGAETVVVTSARTKQAEWKLKSVSCDFPGMNCDTFQ